MGRMRCLALAVVCLCSPSTGAKQKKWPDAWDILGPFPAKRGDWADNAALEAAGGILSLPRGGPLPKLWPAQGPHWSRLEPDVDGVVHWGPRAEFEAWAVGELRVGGSTQCLSATVRGTVREAWFGDRQLPVGWPLQGDLPRGRVEVRVRLHSTGPAQFTFKLAPCKDEVRFLEASEDTPLPDVAIIPGVASIGAVVHVRVHNLRTTWLKKAMITLPKDLNQFVEVFNTTSATLAPNQAGVLLAHVRLTTDVVECPVRLEIVLTAESGLSSPLRTTRRLRCRNASAESYLITYVDRDGSPQVAGLRAPTESCGSKGCPVLLSTHGMDVTAQRQADAYRPKTRMWLLAPHGRSAFAGLNWQNQGHSSAWAALDALKFYSANAFGGSRRADVSRVVFTGHSNGGFGALLLATERPDLALGVAPLAGMTRLHGSVGGSGLQTVLDASMAPYDLTLVAGNIAGIPCLARTGAEDEVIAPSSTAQLAQAVRSGGGQCDAVSVPGKGHWWWDTKTTMDGGVLDDAQMSDFWDKCIEAGLPPLPLQFKLQCVSLSICGGRGGLRLLRQTKHFDVTKVTVRLGMDSTQPWKLSTTNLKVLGWTAVSPAAISIASTGIVIDKTQLGPQDLSAAEYICRDDDGPWRPCPSDALCCGLRRAPRQAGPLRAVFDAPLTIVVGTSPVDRGATANENHLAVAVLLANDRLLVAGGVASVATDAEASLAGHGNLILLGGAAANVLTSELLASGVLPDLRLAPDSIGVGPCVFARDGESFGAMFLAPRPGGEGIVAVFAADDGEMLGRLLAMLHGLSVRNFWQATVPDYVLLGSLKSRAAGPGGVLAAGYWGGVSGWEWEASGTFLTCDDASLDA